MEENGQAAEQIMDTAAGQYQFCRFCEAENECDHSFSKITERANYVLRYLYEFDAGIMQYPLPGSFELQPLWFIKMFQAGRTEMNKIRAAKRKAELDKLKAQR